MDWASSDVEPSTQRGVGLEGHRRRYLWTLAGVGGAASLVGLSRPRPHRPSVFLLGSFLAAYPALRLASRQFKVDRSEAFRHRAGVALGNAFDAVITGTSLRARDIGISIFIVQRRLVPPRDWYLGRVAEVRLVRAFPSTGIAWRPGKGAIGRSWASGDVIALALDESVFDRYATEEQWATVPSEIGLNLTYSEVTALRHRYSAVLAVPIRRGGTVGGVVVMDSAAGTPSHWVSDRRTLRVLIQVLLRAAGQVAVAIDDVPPFVYPKPPPREG
jgi:hypothetical protein